MNKYAVKWIKEFIVLDNCFSTGYSLGFSYSTEEGLPSSQEEVARDLYEFLIQWFTMFPEYQKNDFYVFGESYGGNEYFSNTLNVYVKLQFVSWHILYEKSVSWL